MNFTVKKAIIPIKLRQQPDLLALFSIVIQNEFMS